MLFLPKPCTSFYIKTLHSFLHQNPAQVVTPKPCAAFWTTTLRSFLHQNPAKLFCNNILHIFLDAAIYTKNLHSFFLMLSKWTRKLCTVFCNKTLNRFLHQNPAQLFTPKTLHRFLHKNPALDFTAKPCTCFLTKNLHSFFHQNSAQIFI